MNLDTKKLYVVKSCKRAFMTAATRRRFGLNAGQSLRLTRGDKEADVTIGKAPRTLARTLAFLNVSCLVFLDQYTMTSLGVAQGDTVGIKRTDVDTTTLESDQLARCKQAYTIRVTEGKPIKAVMDALKIGESEAYRKVRIYRDHLAKLGKLA